MGGSDEKKEGKWVWTDGTPVNMKVSCVGKNHLINHDSRRFKEDFIHKKLMKNKASIFWLSSFNFITTCFDAPASSSGIIMI